MSVSLNLFNRVMSFPSIRRNLNAYTDLKYGGKKMTAQMSEQQIYEQAKKRVEARRAFFTHLAVYVVVNTMLVLVWAFAAGRGHPWFIYPLGGWGIGVLFHGLGTFFFLQTSDDAAIEKEAARIRGQ